MNAEMRSYVQDIDRDLMRDATELKKIDSQYYRCPLNPNDEDLAHV